MAITAERDFLDAVNLRKLVDGPELRADCQFESSEQTLEYSTYSLQSVRPEVAGARLF